jgi:hypothetical protein
MSDQKAIAKQETKLAAGVIEQVMLKGDLANLDGAQRLSYYSNLCHSLNLNPLTKPFEYISLNNKLVCYATRSCTDQLRALHKISITIIKREEDENFYKVYARATTPDGRTDESLGMVFIGALKGADRANAFLKAETKAKRRVTLSISGLGFLDETEIETIPDAKKVSAEDVYNGNATIEELTGGYTVPFGKFKDKKLEDIEETELKDYIKWLRERFEMQNKKIDERTQEFFDQAEAYFEGKAMDEEFNQVVARF